MKQLRHVLAMTLVFCMVFGMVTPLLAVSGEISVEEDNGIPVEEDGGIEIEVDDRYDYDIDYDREELSVLPKQNETADENTTGNVDGYEYNIIHLDCGRKYFSVDSIKQIIDNASMAGFNYIQLAVGNDGMRFLLDDMSLTVNGTTYESDAVTAAIHAGNLAYNSQSDINYSTDTNELTQSEMDEIIAYAYEKGMGVIPLINTPGHMDAILSAASSLTGTNCSYNGSVRTIDVTNDTAVAFTKAFLNKYIEYFAEKGCTLFNMGADEYANDVYKTGSMGFGNLQSTEKYSYYVTYVNEIAALIKTVGKKTDMQPMAFNDGIYFNSNEKSGTFDTDIIIEYWSNGWTSYTPMPAADLAEKGFKMVNTNGSYYWVLGKSDSQCDADKARGFNKTAFPGGTISNPVGSTFCIWCDYPGAGTEEYVISETDDTIAAFGAAENLPTVTMPITNANVSNVTVYGLGVASITADTADAPAIENAADGKIEAYAVTAATSAGAFSGYAMIKLPVNKNWDSAKVKAFAVTENDGANTAAVKSAADSTSVTPIDGTYNSDGTYVLRKAPATVGLYETNDTTDPDPTGETVNITLNVGETSEKTINGVAVNETVQNAYAKVVAVDSSVAGGGDYEQATSISSGGTYYISYDGTNFLSLNGSSITNSNEDPTAWTITSDSSGGYIIKVTSGENTYYLYRTGTGTGASLNATSRESSASKWYFDETGIYCKSNNGDKTYYIINSYGTWTVTSTTGVNYGRLYTPVPTTPVTKTTVTITGLAPTAELSNGYTTATVGGVTYNITVNMNQETKDFTVSPGGTAALNVPAFSVDVGTTTTTYAVTSGSEFISVDETGTITAEQVETDQTATVIATVKNAENVVLAIYTYNVTITQENLSTVDPITVEYWITNAKISANGNTSLIITAEQAYGEDGLVLSDIVPATATKDSRTQEYWQSKILDVEKNNNSTSGTELQTTKAGDDETQNGSAFTKIRYYNRKWQVYTAEWIDVDRTQVSFTYTGEKSTAVTYSGDKNQLVAYYMEVIDIKNENNTSELHVNAADWGTKGDGTGNWGYHPESDRCSVSVQIVYEDNSTNPVDTTAANLKSKTIVYGYWNGGRGLGTMIFNGQENYQIYKVTAKTGDMTSSAANDNTVTVTSFTWDNNEETIWEGEATKSVGIGNSAESPLYDAPYDNLTWNTSDYNKNKAILIRVYVKAITKEDSLKVNYVDKETDTNFYNYSITVAENTVFKDGFALVDGVLVNNTVVNYNGITQTVNSDLKALPEVSSYYRNSVFTLDSVKRSEDGKEVWLYYTFNNTHSFVVDFGVTLHIDPADIGLGDVGATWNTATLTAGNTILYGEAEIASGQGLTYMPNKVMSSVERIAIDLSNSEVENDTPATHYIYLYPATNVLYEENVITNPTGSDWTKVTSVFTHATDEEDNNITTQSAEKLGNKEKNVHGYDVYYSENTGFSGGTAYKATLDASKTATEYGKPLTFEFTGNGFDLISECGPQTGALLVRVYKDGVLNHGFFVDTYFTGDNTGIINSAAADVNGVLDYQVPVVRDINLEHGTYKVEVYGYMVNRNTTSTASLYSIDSAETYLEQALRDLGLDDDASLYEVSYMDENSVLNGGIGSEIDVVKSTFSMMSANMADELNTSLADEEATQTAYVYVDGVRVYGTLENYPGYTAKEVNTKYYNVYDFALNSSAGVSDKWDNNSLIYVEKDGNKNLFTIADYKKQGPENEIYLTSGNAVAFVLDGYSDINSTVHISAKAVSGAPIFNGQEVLTNTEMYYDVSELVLSDEKYGKYIVLKNDAVDDTVLSISGIKVSSNIELIANADFGEFIVKELTPAQDDEFKPETFKASIPKSVKKNRKFSISASASADVQEVVVKDSDGNVIISKTQDKANNSSSPYRYSLLVTAPNISGNYSVKVYAKDVNGKLSAPIELTIEVK